MTTVAPCLIAQPIRSVEREDFDGKTFQRAHKGIEYIRGYNPAVADLIQKLAALG